MNTALAFLLGCALTGLFVKLESRRSYYIAFIGGVIVAGTFYSFTSLM